jgi:hypothetical protein
MSSGGISGLSRRAPSSEHGGALTLQASLQRFGVVDCQHWFSNFNKTLSCKGVRMEKLPSGNLEQIPSEKRTLSLLELFMTDFRDTDNRHLNITF